MTELATGYVSIEPEISRTFGSKFSSQASGQMKKSGSSMGGLFGKAFAVAGGIGIASFAKDAISGASDIQESTSKIEAIFGDAGAAILKFSDTGAKALGQSKASVLEAAGTFGTFGKVAGLQGPKLAKFSTGLVSLSTDLASFGNTTPEQAVEALGSALRGEAEPMRKYGVLLDDATLKAEALRLGILKPVKDQSKILQYQTNVTSAQKAYNDAIKEHGPKSLEALKAQAALGTAQTSLKKATEGTVPPLTAQQKVLAAQSAIYRQTKDAQGDFARTSGGLANQQRILAAQWTDMKARIGAVLLPIVTKLVTFLNAHLVPAFGQVSKVAGEVASWLGDKLGPTFERVRGFIAKNPAVLKTMVIALGALAAILGVVALATSLWTAALAINPVTLIVVAIAALVAGLVVAYKKSEAFRKIVQTAGEILRSFAGWVRADVLPVIIDLAQAIAARLRPILAQLVETFQADVLPTIKKVLAKLREWQPTIQKVALVVLKLVAGWIKFYAMIYSKVIPVVVRIAGFILKTVVPAIIKWVEILAKIYVTIYRVGKALVDGVKHIDDFAEAVGDKIGDVVDWFQELPGLIGGKLADIGRWLVKAGRDLIVGLYRGLVQRAAAVLGWVQALPAKVVQKVGNVQRTLLTKGAELILGLFNGLKTRAEAVFTWVYNLPMVILRRIGSLERTLKAKGIELILGLFNGVKDKAEAVYTWLKNLPGKILAKIGDVGDLLLDVGKQIMQGLWDGLKDIWGDVEDWFGDITGKIPDLKGPPARDKKLLEPAGRNIMRGLLRGLSADQPDLVSRLKAVTDQIGNMLKRGAIGKQLAEQMRRIVNGIATEAGKLRGLVVKKLALAKDLASSFRDELDLAALTEGGTNEFGFTAPVSAGAAIAGVQAFVTRLRAFAYKLSKLAKAGMPAALIGEIAGLGSEAGARVADVFLSATRRQVRQLQVAFTGINQASTLAGQWGAYGVYGQQISKQRRELQELLGNQQRQNAREVGRETARALAEADLTLNIDGRAAGRLVLAGRNYNAGHE